MESLNKTIKIEYDEFGVPKLNDGANTPMQLLTDTLLQRHVD